MQDHAREERILIVEDDRAIREVMKIVLSLDGFSVTEAADGIEGLERFVGETFELVITDYEMPGMKGDELVEEIRRLAPAQPILMVSANLLKMEGRLSRVNGFLDKPFLISEFRALVEQLVEQRQTVPLN